MNKIIECVPNFSEGRNREVIEAIAKAIEETKDCRLLDVDPGFSTNRTVYTFVGNPDSVVEGALAAARVARRLIDMRMHTGEHPRFGAMDVCPFVPVAGVTMEECAAIARVFAQRASAELAVPFYLYEEAAQHQYRKKLSDLREGEYEGLAEKLKKEKWKPDCGPDSFVPEWGITAAGARKFLLAYNVNILGTPNQAHRIALNLREAGRGETEPGRLKEVKGMGWFVKEYNMAQVTVNLTDYHVTPLHILFEEVKKEAAQLGVAVAGSELVGLVPKEALMMAAEFYIEKEKLFIYQDDQKIRLAIERLGLNSVSTFIAEQRIIEMMIEEKPDEPLASMSVREFIEEIASRSSAPGGGSASAALAAIGVGLGAMVAKLTQGVRRFESVQPSMEKAIPPLHELTQQLIPLIDADTSAFNEYMEGLRMPKETEEEQFARNKKMQSGLKAAIQIPLATMRHGDSGWQHLIDIAYHGNPASSSDTMVGAKSLEAGIWGAYQNVLINMKGIEDDSFRSQILAEALELSERAEKKCKEVIALLSEK